MLYLVYIFCIDVYILSSLYNCVCNSGCDGDPLKITGIKVTWSSS